MRNNRIIFLDLDGVVNFEDWYRSEDYYNNNFKDPDICPEVIDRLNRLTEETNSKIVISSSWKIDKYCVNRLEIAGLKNIVDTTPDLYFIMGQDYIRGEEIKQWLDKHPDTQYIIIDDTPDFYEDQAPYFVQTDWRDGFTEEKCLLAKNLLNHV